MYQMGLQPWLPQVTDASGFQRLSSEGKTAFIPVQL
jgi:hypothetical protein